MTSQKSDCPDQQTLQQFLLGRLSVSEIEGCQQHLSQCDPCVETVENLKVEDTFTELACEVLRENAIDLSAQDDQFISQMIAEAGAWTVGGTKATELKVSMDKAAEVQRLVREPIQHEDLGAIEHFRLIRLIGTGSTGIVYLAIDTKLDRNVVLKVLRPSLGEPARQRFIAEAKATAAIDHPNVVTIYEVGNDGPLSYIAMQWIPGQTLEEKLVTEKSLSIEQTRKLAGQIAEGLSAAHSQGLIHRDIKPANVWIPDNDEPAKILDFGLVRVNDEDPQLTCTGMIAGTPCFMSPEQSRGDRLDERSDLFSLGCLMYQSLTGQLPFRSDNALATLRSIQHDQPTKPSELDPSIDSETSDLVMCLLAKSPNRRPASANALIKALSTQPEQWDFELATALDSSESRTHSKSSIGKLVASLLVGIALSAFGFAYGKQIVRIAMNEGEIKIETKVDDVKIEILGDGDFVQVVDLATQQSIDIKAGKYEIRALGKGNSISIDKNRLTLSRGEVEIVQITRSKDTTPKNSNPTEIRVFPLVNTNASIVFLTIKSLLGLDESDLNSKVTYNEQRNQIVATGTVAQLDIIGRLIKEMDHDGKRNPVVQFDPKQPYILAGGDVLGIFIDGVLGGFDEAPPVHIPDSRAGLAPSLGFPVLVEHDGLISLPYVDAIKAEGKTLEQLRKSINDAFKKGEEPILREQSRIIVTLFKMRDHRSVLQPYPLDSGDVLGVFIDGVLGQYDDTPPIHSPLPNSESLPSIGFPVAVEHDGFITLPFVDRIEVRGNTISDVRKAVTYAFKEDVGDGTEPLLQEQARIMVNLIRPRIKSNGQPTKPLPSELEHQNVNASNMQLPAVLDRPITNENSRPKETGSIAVDKSADNLPSSIQKNDFSLDIKKLELERSIMQQRFGPNHPNLMALEKKIELLNKFVNTKKESHNSSQPSEVPDLPPVTDRTTNQVAIMKQEAIGLRKKAEQGLVEFFEVFKAESKLYNAIITQPDATLDSKLDAASNLIAITEEELESQSDKKESKNLIDLKRWHDLLTQRQNAIRNQTRFEREMGLPVSQPVFDGSTYHELLDISKTERDLAKLNKAIVGLVNLAGKYEQEEAANTIMQIARRRTGIASAEDRQNFDQSMQQFFRTLDLKSMTKIFVNEMEFGSSYSRRHLKSFRYNSRTKLPLFYQTFRSTVSDDIQSKESAAAIAKVLAKTSKSKSEKDFAFDFLTKVFYDQWNALELNDNQDVKLLFASYVAEFRDVDYDNNWIATMWNLAPETTGLTEVVERYLGQLSDRLLQSTGMTNNIRSNTFTKVQTEILSLDDDPKLAESLSFEFKQFRLPQLKISDGKIVISEVLDVETLHMGNNLLRSYKQKFSTQSNPEGVRTYLDVEDSKLYVAGPLAKIWELQSKLSELDGGEEMMVVFPSTNNSRNKWYEELSKNQLERLKKEGELILENLDERFVEEFLILPATQQNSFEFWALIPSHEYKNGTITFKINDKNLDTLKRNGLSHRIQERFKNQILKVKLIYEKSEEVDSVDRN